MSLLQLQQQIEERRGLNWFPDTQHRPQAMSSPNETASQVAESSGFVPALSEDTQLRDAVLDILHDQHELVRRRT
jgi:hypothetical protein